MIAALGTLPSLQVDIAAGAHALIRSSVGPPANGYQLAIENGQIGGVSRRAAIVFRGDNGFGSLVNKWFFGTDLTGTSDEGFFIQQNGVAAVNCTLAILPGGTIGFGTNAPNANALLDITSTTKAFMPPRMTTTQRDAIAAPTSGMVVYNSTTGKLNVRGAAGWEAVTSA